MFHNSYLLFPRCFIRIIPHKYSKWLYSRTSLQKIKRTRTGWVNTVNQTRMVSQFMSRSPTNPSTRKVPQSKEESKGSGRGELWKPSRSRDHRNINLDSSLPLPMMWNSILHSPHTHPPLPHTPSSQLKTLILNFYWSNSSTPVAYNAHYDQKLLTWLQRCHMPVLCTISPFNAMESWFMLYQTVSTHMHAHTVQLFASSSLWAVPPGPSCWGTSGWSPSHPHWSQLWNALSQLLGKESGNWNEERSEMQWHSISKWSAHRSHDCHMMVTWQCTGALTHFSCLHIVNRAIAGGGVHRWATYVRATHNIIQLCQFVMYCVNLSLIRSCTYLPIPFPTKSTWHKVASQHHSTSSFSHQKVSPCHSLYHHVTLQEVQNLFQPLRVHGPPNKGVTVPLDQEEGHSSQQTWTGQRDKGTVAPAMDYGCGDYRWL